MNFGMYKEKGARIQKIQIIVFMLLHILQGSAQVKKDTIFLIHDEIQKIYIAPDKESGYYKSLTSFFDSNVKRYKQRKEKIKKWVPLYQYHEDYYLYVPCDFGYHNPIQIAEKELLIGGMVTRLYKINKKSKSLGSHHIKIEYQDYDGKIQYLEYTMIDEQKEIAVFMFQNEYRFMVSAEKVMDYPIIVNESKRNKVSEFVFEPLDYKTLLKQTN